MSGNPQDTIANLCTELLELVPGSDIIGCAQAMAREGLATDHTITTLVAELARIVTGGHRHDGPLLAIRGALSELLGPDDVPATVAEIRDIDNCPIYRVDNAAGTQLYAWLESKGWESTGWTLASYFDDIEPVPGREDLPRGAWPVGLAALVAEALDELDTSEPYDGACEHAAFGSAAPEECDVVEWIDEVTLV